jgi:metal-responsive CopG/Arc/MetJ family transcriptional regulator
MERVMLTLPPELLGAVDEAARRLGHNRSQVVRQALAEWLARRERQEFEALLTQGYQELAEHASSEIGDWLSPQVAAAEGVWRWDEGRDE